MKPIIWRLIPFVCFILVAIFLWKGLSLNPQHLPSVKLGKPLPLFQLNQFGNEQVLNSAQLRGQVILLNVWASWCASCADEHVFLMQLSREGIPIYGLNYKDNEDEAQNWLKEWGNPYKRIGSDTNGRVAIDLGVYGTPETFLIDKDGMIQYRHAGPLNDQVWKKEFLPKINQLETPA